MARPLRIQYPGAVYHVTSRGNERKEIFRDDKDRQTFLEILSQSIRIYNIKLYSYVLMGNHFHFLLETPLGNLGEFMRHFNITYTGYFNRRHKRVGHLYQGRYKSILVNKDEYLSILSRYIHLNPVRLKKMMKEPEIEKVEYLVNYQWSSLPGYIERGKREEFIDYEMVLGEYGGDNARGRKIYKNRIHSDIKEGIEIKDKVIGQSILGGEEFVEWIKERFLKERQDRESPSLRELKRYRAKEVIMKAIEKVTGKSLEEIKASKGRLRQIATDLLYRIGGLKGVEIGNLMGVDYSTVSQGRKRLRDKMQKDKNLREMVSKIERNLSI
jgi:REP element-mobilizing transposase RayT